MLYAGAIRLRPGRRSRGGGENSSPRSTFVSATSASETPIKAYVETTYERKKRKVAAETSHRIVSRPISHDSERRECQRALDRPPGSSAVKRLPRGFGSTG